MRTFSSALLAGAAALALGLSGSPAMAQSQGHVMTVRLPDGGIAQVRYAGDVAPQISVSAAPAPSDVFASMPAFFGPGSAFGELERISAEMDRQAAAMFRQAEALAGAARSGQPVEAAMRNLPPGSQGYTFISTMSGNGICSQSFEITAAGNGAAPRIVSHSSGNCGPAGGVSGSVNLPTAAPPAEGPGPVRINAPTLEPRHVPAPAARPDVVWTSAHGAHPFAGLVQPIPPAER